ncbi:MAG: S8 family serine peptidase [Caldilineaceae bacterium]|nr:S8 family serine peptidase [Caldilineaceae bacterium]
MINTTHNHKRLILIILLAFLFWFSLQLVNPVHAGSKPSDSAHTVLIKFQEDTPAANRASVIGEMGGEETMWLAAISTAQVQLPTNWATARSGSDALSIASKSPFVRSVEFDAVVAGIPAVEERMKSVPWADNSTIPMAPIRVNDADYNNPQMQVYAPDIIQLTLAWNYTMGSPDVKIAILDSGILASHPEFAGRVLPGYDFINDDTDPHDDYGHGTHVAGIAAAGANNNIGMLGVCPRCSIIPVKVLDNHNQGSWASVAAGILFSVDAGANVINLSLGGTSISQAVEDAIQYAVEHNVLVVAAAGNGRSDTPFYPAALDGVVGVAATRNDDTRWSLSNYGSFVEVSAPGYAVYSTYNDLNNTYHGYNYMSGTSMAAPHVAGLAGLIFSQNPKVTVAQVRARLQSTAVDLGDPGRDDYFGYGRINVFASLQAGAPVIQPDAAASGVVWQDKNINGVWEQDERAATETLLIQLRHLDGTLIKETTPNEAGQWRIADIYPGSYRIVAQAIGNTRITTQHTFTIDLQSGQEITGLNFGTAQIDPAASTFRVFAPTIQGTR